MPDAGERLRRAAPWFWSAAAIVVLDQATKWVVQSALAAGESRPVTMFFNLVLTFNRGAAFNFLSNASGWQRPLLAAISIAAVLIVSFMLLRHPGNRLLCAGLALVLGGALGNLCDRLSYGHVVDFLDFHAFGWHWPAFNVADSAITIGAGVLILESFVGHEARRAHG